jgi:hypothetical protein
VASDQERVVSQLGTKKAVPIVRLDHTRSFHRSNKMAATIAESTSPAIAPAALRRISWGAVFAGAIVAIAIELMLGVLGVGVGASTINVHSDTSPISGLGLGAAIWFVISALISIYIGGWVAGKLAGVPSRTDGALHGFITWALATLALFYLLTTALGAVLGGTASFLNGAAGVVSKTTSSAGPTVMNAVSDMTGTTPQDLQNQAGALANDPQFKNFVSSVLHNGQVSPADRQNLVNLVAQRQNISQAQADAEVTHWQQELQQDSQELKTKATSAADTAASGAAQAGIWTFVMLILALIVGCGGGAMGAPENSMLIPIRTRTIR